MTQYVVSIKPRVKNVKLTDILIQYNGATILENDGNCALVEMSRTVKLKISEAHPELVIEKNKPYRLA